MQSKTVKDLQNDDDKNIKIYIYFRKMLVFMTELCKKIFLKKSRF